MVANCVNYGTVYSEGRLTGGIVGRVYSIGSVINNVNFGSVTGSSRVGGVVGCMDGKNTSVANNYNMGNVRPNDGSNDYIGAIVGRNVGDDGSAEFNYYLKDCAKGGDGKSRNAMGKDGGSVTDGTNKYYAASFEKPASLMSDSAGEHGAGKTLIDALNSQAVTVADVIGCCGGELPAEPEIPEATLLPEPRETAVNFKPKLLPMWRKLLAGVSLVIAMLVFFYATSITDLSALIGKEGISATGEQQLSLYLVLIAALGVFIAAIGRRSAPSAMLQLPTKQRKLSKRTLVATVLIVLCIPLTIFAGVMYLGNQHYNITAMLVLVECMVPFVLVFESRRPKARELVTIAVLCAIGVAGRSVFFMLPQFKPVLALVIISGVAFGGETGFLVGVVTMLAANLLFSQGPWTPWQMFSMGIIGFLAGVLFRKGLLRRSRGSLAIFGAFAAVIIYGGIMNPAAALMYNSQSINWEMIKGYYVTGLPMDLIHAAATVIFILITAEPMLEKLDRIKLKYGLVE